jgi:hypothetical protein
MAARGAPLMGATFLLTNFVSTLEELEAVRHREWLKTSVIGIASMAHFYFFAAAESTLTPVLLWPRARAARF